MNLHHAITIFVMILALIAIIIASIAISGDIDYKTDTIPGKAIKNHAQLFRADVNEDLFNATLSATDEQSMSAVVNRNILKNTNENHLHIRGIVVQPEAADLNLLFGSSNIAGFTAGGDVLQNIPLGVTSEGVRFSNVSRSQLTSVDQKGYVEIGADTAMTSSYRVILPNGAPTAGQVLEVDTDITKLKWGNKNEVTDPITATNDDITFSIGGAAAGGTLTLTNTSTGTDKNVVINSDGGNVDIDAGGNITLDAKDGNSINIGTSTDTAYDTSTINIGTSNSSRTITIGHDSSTKVDVNAADIELDSAGPIVLNSTTTTSITSTGGMTLSSGGVLAIDTVGTDAINFGTQGVAKTITIGHDASTKVDINAADIELDSAGPITLDSTTTTSITSTTGMTLYSGGILTIDTVGTDNINFGTEAQAKTITIGSDTSTKVDINAADIELDSAGPITLDSVGLLRLDSNANKILLESGTNADADAIKLHADAGGIYLRGDLNSAFAIHLDTDHANGGVTIETGSAGVDVNAGSGNVTIDTTGAISLDSQTASNFSTTGAHLTLSTITSGDVIINSVDKVDIDAGNDIDITATGSSVNISSTGGVAAAIHLNSSATGGGIDIDADTGGIDIDCTGTTGNLSLDTAGGEIQIGANAAAGNISVGTNAAVRTITLGYSTVATTVAIKGNTTINGKIKTTDTTAPAVLYTTAGNGTATLIATSTDSAGIITIANTWADGDTITITWNSAYTTAPVVIVTGCGFAHKISSTSTVATIEVTGALEVGQLHYFVIETV